MNKRVRQVLCVLISIILLAGCGQKVSDTSASISDNMPTSTPDTLSTTPTANLTLEDINLQIVEEMKKPRSLIYGVGIGWATIDGKVTGFGPDGKESRVVVEVDSTVYDSYVKKWSSQYNDMVYVEPVTAIMDELSTYSDLINQNTSIIMESEYDTYNYGTDKVILNIKNQTDTSIGFGDMEIYEKLVGGEWRTIFQDYFSDCVACIINANAAIDYELTIPLYIMDFEKGTYRVIKNINDSYYSAEFKIK